MKLMQCTSRIQPQGNKVCFPCQNTNLAYHLARKSMYKSRWRHHLLSWSKTVAKTKKPHTLYMTVYTYLYRYTYVCVPAYIYIHICICAHTGSLPTWNIVSIQNCNIENFIIIIILNNIFIFFWKSISDLKLLPQSIKIRKPHQSNTIQK